MSVVDQELAVTLPSAGPISATVAGLLSRPAEVGADRAAPLAEVEAHAAEVGDPLGEDDLQLALYLCFELHYRSFAGVDPDWEWSPGLIAIRGVLERTFFAALAWPRT